TPDAIVTANAANIKERKINRELVIVIPPPTRSPHRALSASQTRYDEMRAGILLERIPVGSNDLTALPIVAALVPATRFFLALRFNVRGRRDKPGDDDRNPI